MPGISRKSNREAMRAVFRGPSMPRTMLPTSTSAPHNLGTGPPRGCVRRLVSSLLLLLNVMGVPSVSSGDVEVAMRMRDAAQDGFHRDHVDILRQIGEVGVNVAGSKEGREALDGVGHRSVDVFHPQPALLAADVRAGRPLAWLPGISAGSSVRSSTPRP